MKKISVRRIKLANNIILFAEAKETVDRFDFKKLPCAKILTMIGAFVKYNS